MFLSFFSPRSFFTLCFRSCLLLLLLMLARTGISNWCLFQGDPRIITNSDSAGKASPHYRPGAPDSHSASLDITPLNKNLAQNDLPLLVRQRNRHWSSSFTVSPFLAYLRSYSIKLVPVLYILLPAHIAIAIYAYKSYSRLVFSHANSVIIINVSRWLLYRNDDHWC